jgi:hypothetical protein
MDTLKEKTAFDEMYRRGDTPWMVWEHDRDSRPREPVTVPRWSTTNGSIVARRN